MMEEIRVRRSGVRMWLLALAGVPMVVIGIDILMRRRIFGAVGSLVFTGDPQLVEPRDVIWGGRVVGPRHHLHRVRFARIVAPCSRSWWPMPRDCTCIWAIRFRVW